MRADPSYLAHDADIAPVAALLADPTRSAMLSALLDGRALAAGELARLAGVSPATASAHLARLLAGGLVSVICQGRHRYYRLAGHEVAAALEVLAALAPRMPVRGLRQSRQAEALARARTCYDHLAGRAGVALLDAMLARGMMTVTAEHTAAARTQRADAGIQPDCIDVTAAGAAALREFGIDVESLGLSRRRFAASCLDWTERRPHLGGSLGAAILSELFDRGWVERGSQRRAVRVTPAGEAGLAGTFGWSSS